VSTVSAARPDPTSPPTILWGSRVPLEPVVGGWVHAARDARGPLAGRARHWAGLRSGASGVRAADGKASAGGHRRGSAQAAAAVLVIGPRAVQRPDAEAEKGSDHSLARFA
jgi:hypothetical protein